MFKDGFFFSNEERWDPNAIENIRGLPLLWDTTKYDHEEVPHVKMDDLQDRDYGNHEYGRMMGFDNSEGRLKRSFQVTKKLIKEFGKLLDAMDVDIWDTGGEFLDTMIENAIYVFSIV